MRQKRDATKGKNVYSYTTISDFLRCPYLFKHLYLDKGEAKSNVAMQRGREIHKLCEKLALVDDPEQVNEIMKGYDETDRDRAIRFAEYFIDKTIPQIRTSDGNFNNGIELYDKIKIGRDYLEIHIDNIHYTKDGTLRIMDIKTGKVVPSKNEIENDLQLQLYAFAVVKMLQLSDTAVPPRIQVGLWLWEYGYNVFIDYEFPEDMEDRIKKIIDKIKKAKKTGDFPKIANQFCSGCPVFHACYPQEIAETYQQCKELADFWAEKAKKKKIELINKMEVMGVDTLKEGDISYYLTKKVFKDIDIDDFISKVGTDIDTLKHFLKPTKTALKKYGIKDVKEIEKSAVVELRYKVTI